MKQHEASKLLRGLKQAFSEQTIGRATGFFKRERKMTPMKMMMSLLSCFAGGQSTTLADVQRSYNALSPTSMAYKPFHNQLSKEALARFMPEIASHVLSTLVVEVLKPSRAGLLAEFGRVFVQDGSSLAHSVQIIAEVATSTLRTARCAWQVIPAIVEALLTCAPRRLRAAFMRAICTQRATCASSSRPA